MHLQTFRVLILAPLFVLLSWLGLNSARAYDGRALEAEIRAEIDAINRMRAARHPTSVPRVVSPRPVTPPRPAPITPLTPTVVAPPKSVVVAPPPPAAVVPGKPSSQPLVVAKPVLGALRPPAALVAVHAMGIQGATPGHLSLNSTSSSINGALSKGRYVPQDAGALRESGGIPIKTPTGPAVHWDWGRPVQNQPPTEYPIYTGNPDLAFKPALCDFFPCDPTEAATGKVVEELAKMGCNALSLGGCTYIGYAISIINSSIPSPDDYSNPPDYSGFSFPTDDEFMKQLKQQYEQQQQQQPSLESVP
jgi:hypothetical protein